MFITENPKALAAIALFISTDETRYYLKGVNIEAHPEGGAVFTATDGHRLGTFHDRDATPPDNPVILPMSKEILSALKNKRAFQVKWEKDVLTVSEGRNFEGEPEILGLLGSFQCTAIDGTYPDWRSVLPKNTKSSLGGQAPGFNPEYIATFCKAAKLLSNGVLTPIQVVSNGHDAPAAIVFPRSANFRGVLMPIRI